VKRVVQSLPLRVDQPDAERIAPGHQPVAVVLDLMNPVGTGRRLVGRQGSMKRAGIASLM